MSLYAASAALKEALKLTGSLADWRGDLWVHYSAVPKLGINPQQSHDDPAGLYLFPAEFDHQRNWDSVFWDKPADRKYKTYVRLKPGIKVLDLSALSVSELRDLVRDVMRVNGVSLRRPLTLVHDAQTAWDFMRRLFPKQAARWNKALRALGYDAVFDDVGAVFNANDEVQLIVLDVRAVREADVRLPSIRGGFQALESLTKTLAEKLRAFGQVEVTPPRRVRRPGIAKQDAPVESLIFVQRGDKFVSLVLQIGKAQRPFVSVILDETQPAIQGAPSFRFDPMTGQNEMQSLLQRVAEVLGDEA